VKVGPPSKIADVEERWSETPFKETIAAGLMTCPKAGVRCRIPSGTTPHWYRQRQMADREASGEQLPPACYVLRVRLS
jgi:hypothetical protein